MTLVSNTGSFAKVKDIKVVLSGFASTPGYTSTFGAGSDINCTDVEYLSLQLPEKSENEETTIPTNLRDMKDSVANKGWESWSGLEVFNDSNFVNFKAFVAAQETDATGTVTFSNRTGTGTIMSLKCKVAKAGGGGGDANAIHTSFTPTFTILEEGSTAST
jgi:hypothetical protein